MLYFLLNAALVLGQTETTPGQTEETTAPDPSFLMHCLQGTELGCLLESRKVQISGWTDLSFTASSDRQNNLPLGFNFLANDFLLQQNWLRLERLVETKGTEPSCGFRCDTILPGSDYRFTQARGLFNGQLSANDGQPNLYGIDPIQFYAEAYFPNVAKGMDVKVGRFVSQVCVEVNDAPGNALFSHAYTFIYDPFTHTGILSTTQLSDAWSVQAGLVLGSDVFIDPAAEPTFIGSVKWAQAEQKSSALFSVILGSGRFNQEQNFNNVNVFDLVFTHQFSKELSYNLDAMAGYQTNVPQIGTATWLGFVNYLTWSINPNLSGTLRLELFDDEQGQRTGFEGLYTAVTGGLTIKPCNSLVFRPELRYDYQGESRPFENKHGLFTAAADIILRW